MSEPSHSAPPSLPSQPSSFAASRSVSQVDNKPSLWLGKEENELLFSLIGKRRFTLATAVARLVSSTASSPEPKWVQICVPGVACFVKDNVERSYFIRFYDIFKTKTCVWQQEIHRSFEYKITKPLFHTFPSGEFLVGLEFANSIEADEFKNIVEEKLLMRQQHRLLRKQAREKKRKQRGGSVDTLVESVTEENDWDPTISLPFGFVHVQHIEWNRRTGYEMKGVSQEMKEFFYSSFLAGDSEEKLKNDETRNFIQKFIGSNDGVQKAIEPARDVPSLRSSQLATSLTESAQSSQKGEKSDQKAIEKLGMKESDGNTKISLPFNFVHVQHVGYDSETRFDTKSDHVTSDGGSKEKEPARDVEEPSSPTSQQKAQIPPTPTPVVPCLPSSSRVQGVETRPPSIRTSRRVVQKAEANCSTEVSSELSKPRLRLPPIPAPRTGKMSSN